MKLELAATEGLANGLRTILRGGCGVGGRVAFGVENNVAARTKTGGRSGQTG
jgi:hypothetical protein